MDKYLHLDMNSYFDEDDRIDIEIHLKDDTVVIHDIKPMVNWWHDDWFTVELMGRYAKAMYFRSEDVVYFTIVPVENGNKNKWVEDTYAF